jgi:hypothetical protein
MTLYRFNRWYRRRRSKPPVSIVDVRPHPTDNFPNITDEVMAHIDDVMCRPDPSQHAPVEQIIAAEVHIDGRGR